MLSITEIRTLIKAHNKLSKITIPAGAKRADLIKLLSNKGYSVDHKNKNIVKKARTEVITLKGAKILTEPVKKTDEQKAKVVAKKKEKEEKKKEETKAVVKQAKKEAVKEFKEKKKAAQKPKKKATPPVKKAEPVKKATAPVKKAVSKGSHKMPDGSIMKNKDMPKKSKRKVLKETQKPSGSAVVQPGKPADLKIKKKLGKSIQEKIKEGVELNIDNTRPTMRKDKCKLFIYASKQIIKADKDNFKKVRITENMPTELSEYGSDLLYNLYRPPGGGPWRKASPVSYITDPLLILFYFMTRMLRSEDTMKDIRKDCGVQEAIFVETAYDILYRRYDLIEERIMKQNPKLKGLDQFVKKPKKIDYLYYEPKN